MPKSPVCGSGLCTVRKDMAGDAGSGSAVRAVAGGHPAAGGVNGVRGADRCLAAWRSGVETSLMHERLVTEHQFASACQRVKDVLLEARPRRSGKFEEADENRLFGFHRRD